MQVSENDPNLPEEQKIKKTSTALLCIFVFPTTLIERKKEGQKHSQEHLSPKTGQKNKNTSKLSGFMWLCCFTVKKNSTLEPKSYNKYGSTTTGSSESFHLDLHLCIKTSLLLHFELFAPCKFKLSFLCDFKSAAVVFTEKQEEPQVSVTEFLTGNIFSPSLQKYSSKAKKEEVSCDFNVKHLKLMSWYFDALMSTFPFVL